VRQLVVFVGAPALRGGIAKGQPRDGVAEEAVDLRSGLLVLGVVERDTLGLKSAIELFTPSSRDSKIRPK